MIGGGKGLRKARADLLGELAVIQGCTLHKKRNLLAHLPQSRRAHVARALAEAWSCDSAELARWRLKTLLQWLERNGEDSAAASLREGMEETLTVPKLDLPPALSGLLITTNPIENLIGSVRRVTRNVTCWRDGDMIGRWTALGLLHAEQRLRPIRGYRHLPMLAQALPTRSSEIDPTVEAA